MEIVKNVVGITLAESFIRLKKETKKLYIIKKCGIKKGEKDQSTSVLDYFKLNKNL